MAINDELSKALAGDKLVLVDFWAAWCGPCRMVAPIVEEIKKDYEGKLVVLKVNADESPELTSKYEITALPTLVFFKNGKVVERVIGFTAKKGLTDIADRLMS